MQSTTRTETGCRGKISDSRGGAAIVEVAMTLPIFFLVVFAIIEFGRAMMVSQLLTNAAREGARKAGYQGFVEPRGRVDLPRVSCIIAGGRG